MGVVNIIDNLIFYFIEQIECFKTKQTFSENYYIKKQQQQQPKYYNQGKSIPNRIEQAT